MASHIHVVLTDDIHNVGKSGELARVRPGFARNYLLPRGLAVTASKDNVARIEHEKRAAGARAAKLRGEAQELATKLEALKLTLEHAVGEEDRLYGSVTSRDVEEALTKHGYHVDRRRIVMEPIRALGTVKVPVRLATSVTANLEVTVVAKTK